MNSEQCTRCKEEGLDAWSEIEFCESCDSPFCLDCKNKTFKDDDCLRCQEENEK